MEHITPVPSAGTASAAAGEADLFQLDMQDFGPGYTYENAASLCICHACHCGGCHCGYCACFDILDAEG